MRRAISMGTGDNDYADFRLFKSDFNSANGAGAFEAQVFGVPEPSSLRLGVVLVVAWLGSTRRYARSTFGDRKYVAHRAPVNDRRLFSFPGQPSKGLGP